MICTAYQILCGW